MVSYLKFSHCHFLQTIKTRSTFLFPVGAHVHIYQCWLTPVEVFSDRRKNEKIT